MSAQFLLSSIFPVKPGGARRLADAITKDEGRRVLVSVDADEVLELRVLSEGATIDALAAMLMPEADQFAEFLAGDVRRELLSFVEAPKDCKGLLPQTPFIQLRHVEVKPEQMVAYRQWRDETIFEVVRTHDAAEVFLAYHSVVSGQPGVMFIAGFSADQDVYTSVFTSERYGEIVRQAGETYITGGREGLYTKIYQSVSAEAA